LDSFQELLRHHVIYSELSSKFTGKYFLSILNPSPAAVAKFLDMVNLIFSASWKKLRVWRRTSSQKWIQKGVNAYWFNGSNTRKENSDFNDNNRNFTSNDTLHFGNQTPEGPGDKVGPGPSQIELDLFRSIRGIYR